MGQIKNIKLHIVTDIKTKIRRCSEKIAVEENRLLQGNCSAENAFILKRNHGAEMPHFRKKKIGIKTVPITRRSPRLRKKVPNKIKKLFKRLVAADPKDLRMPPLRFRSGCTRSKRKLSDCGFLDDSCCDDMCMFPSAAKEFKKKENGIRPVPILGSSPSLPRKALPNKMKKLLKRAAAADRKKMQKDLRGRKRSSRNPSCLADSAIRSSKRRFSENTAPVMCPFLDDGCYDDMVWDIAVLVLSLCRGCDS